MQATLFSMNVLKLSWALKIMVVYVCLLLIFWEDFCPTVTIISGQLHPSSFIFFLKFVGVSSNVLWLSFVSKDCTLKYSWVETELIVLKVCAHSICDFFLNTLQLVFQIYWQMSGILYVSCHTPWMCKVFLSYGAIGVSSGAELEN